MCALVPRFGLVGALPPPAEPVPQAASEKLPAGRVPLGNGVRLGLPLAFYSSLGSSVGKSSPRVVATADGALLFPQVPCAAWCSVSGRLKKKKGK